MPVCLLIYNLSYLPSKDTSKYTAPPPPPRAGMYHPHRFFTKTSPNNFTCHRERPLSLPSTSYCNSINYQFIPSVTSTGSLIVYSPGKSRGPSKRPSRTPPRGELPRRASRRRAVPFGLWPSGTFDVYEPWPSNPSASLGEDNQENPLKNKGSS